MHNNNDFSTQIRLIINLTISQCPNKKLRKNIFIRYIRHKESKYILYYIPFTLVLNIKFIIKI